MSTSAILCDVNVDDTRPYRENKLTRFMKRREMHDPTLQQQQSDSNLEESSTITPKSMIDMICNMKENDLFGKENIIVLPKN